MYYLYTIFLYIYKYDISPFIFVGIILRYEVHLDRVVIVSSFNNQIVQFEKGNFFWFEILLLSNYQQQFQTANWFESEQNISNNIKHALEMTILFC